MANKNIEYVVKALVVGSSIVGIWQGIAWYRRKKKQDAMQLKNHNEALDAKAVDDAVKESSMSGIYDKAILAGIRQYRDCNY